MVDVSNRQRQPSGIPQGGEFKKEQKGLDAGDLVAPPARPARPTREQRAPPSGRQHARRTGLAAGR